MGAVVGLRWWEVEGGDGWVVNAADTGAGGAEEGKGPTHPQRVAAELAIRLLLEFQRTGCMPSVDTATLREETWERVAARWLELIDDSGAQASDIECL